MLPREDLSGLTFQLLLGLFKAKLRVRLKDTGQKREQAFTQLAHGDPGGPREGDPRMAPRKDTQGRHTHFDTALAPQSNTFPARSPLTRASCLCSQLNFSRDANTFR